MNLFEFQGKKLFSDYGVRVPNSILVSCSEEVPELPLGGVVKPQVLVGGRGKVGAIQPVDTADEAKALVEHFLKTPIKDHLARKILIEDKIDIAAEYYFSIFINRKNKCISLMFSDAGGVEIERDASDNVAVVDVNPLISLKDYKVKTLLEKFDIQCADEIAEAIKKLYQLFIDKKMMQLEVNPLVVTGAGEVIALDAKVILDGWVVDEDVRLENQLSGGTLTAFEQAFADVGAGAVEMDGDIVVYASGAGVSMAIADSITRRGGKIRAIIDKATMPTDHPDEAVSIKMAEIEKMMLTLNPKVIFLNIYYQAGRMDYECRTMRLAFEEASKSIPVIARCRGRMAEEGVKLLEGSGIRVINSYEEACAEVVRLAEV